MFCMNFGSPARAGNSHIRLYYCGYAVRTVYHTGGKLQEEFLKGNPQGVENIWIFLRFLLSFGKSDGTIYVHAVLMF